MITGDKGTPSAIHAGMSTITPEAHAANIPGALRVIARRLDADEPAIDPAFPTMAAMYASMLGLDEVLAPMDTAHGVAVQHLITGHTMTRRPVLR